MKTEGAVEASNPVRLMFYVDLKGMGPEMAPTEVIHVYD